MLLVVVVAVLGTRNNSVKLLANLLLKMTNGQTEERLLQSKCQKEELRYYSLSICLNKCSLCSEGGATWMGEQARERQREREIHNYGYEPFVNKSVGV